MRISEHDEQVALIEWCDLKRILVVAIPNGGHRHVVTAVKLKREGVRPGFPDLFFPIPRRYYHGMFIEMKAATGGKVTDFQQHWHKVLSDAGYYVRVAKGFEEAKKIVEWYMADTSRTV